MSLGGDDGGDRGGEAGGDDTGGDTGRTTSASSTGESSTGVSGSAVRNLAGEAGLDSPPLRDDSGASVPGLAPPSLLVPSPPPVTGASERGRRLDVFIIDRIISSSSSSSASSTFWPAGEENQSVAGPAPPRPLAPGPGDLTPPSSTSTSTSSSESSNESGTMYPVCACGLSGPPCEL